MKDLEDFIASNPETRELKRALAVQMTLKGYTHAQIMNILQISSGYISKWKEAYIVEGIEGLKLRYKGSKGYLSQEEKEQVLSWLRSKDYWNLNELECYISEQFGVAFVAKSSYYDLFHEAGISWKKSQKINPYKDSEKVELKKEEICKWLEQHRDKIERGELEVYFVDECHLSWGDSCGYVWGKTNLRIEIPIKNEREKQTYYGALNYLTGKVIIEGYEKGETKNSIAFVEHLRNQSKKQIVIIWDGASYHRSEEFKNYLSRINKEHSEEEWIVKCIQLAPNAPEQNPIEDVWLQGKSLVRTFWQMCKSFKAVKWIFEWAISEDIFRFKKLSMYGKFLMNHS